MPLLDMNGLRVEYHQSGGGPDSGSQLLLLHSLLTDMAVFDLVLPKLCTARRVTRINLPGFGASGPVALESVGALDQTTPPALARTLAQGIAGARYEEIPGSGHCPMLEQPAALVRLMGGFLAAGS